MLLYITEQERSLDLLGPPRERSNQQILGARLRINANDVTVVGQWSRLG